MSIRRLLLRLYLGVSAVYYSASPWEYPPSTTPPLPGSIHRLLLRLYLGVSAVYYSASTWEYPPSTTPPLPGSIHRRLLLLYMRVSTVYYSASTWEYPPPAAPPLIPKVGPWLGCRTQANTFFLGYRPHYSVEAGETKDKLLKIKCL